jgi:ribosomal protein S18 acetylase RimI-like enzyme
MEYRQANRNDVAAFVENRLEFSALFVADAEMDAFRNRTKRYLEEHIDRDDLMVFLAVDDGRIVSSCMACLFLTAPLPSCPTGKSATLLNVYTLEAYRRQGHAETIVRMLIERLREAGADRVLLDYTDLGLPLYRKLGFVEREKQMQMRLR